MSSQRPVLSRDDTRPDPRTSLRERFPVLRRLESPARLTQVPYVQQNTALDCGPACLASVLRFHGVDVRLEQLRELCAPGRDGTSALLLVQAAERFGLRGRGVNVDVDAARRMPMGTILHWGFHHFVVFERMRGEQIEIVDPAAGRRRVPMGEFRKQFTGVALLFEKSESFISTRRRPSLWIYARRYLAQRPMLFRIVVVSALLQLFGLGLPILTGVLVDRVIPRNDLQLLQVLLHERFRTGLRVRGQGRVVPAPTTREHLNGYASYAEQVRARLLPGAW